MLGLVRNTHQTDMTSTLLKLPDSEICPGEMVEVISGKDREGCKRVA